MKKIKCIFAKIRLYFAKCRANTAKERMDRTIRSSHAAAEEIEYSYENFLARCKQQEKAAVKLKRLMGGDLPMVDIDLGIEHFIAQPSAAKKLTRLDMEVAVTRHRYGDWGDVTMENWHSNNIEAKNPYGYLRSRYPMFGQGYFIVETDRRTNRTEIYLDGAA